MKKRILSVLLLSTLLTGCVTIPEPQPPSSEDETSETQPPSSEDETSETPVVEPEPAGRVVLGSGTGKFSPQIAIGNTSGKSQKASLNSNTETLSTVYGIIPDGQHQFDIEIINLVLHENRPRFFITFFDSEGNNISSKFEKTGRDKDGFLKYYRYNEHHNAFSSYWGDSDNYFNRQIIEKISIDDFDLETEEGFEEYIAWLNGESEKLVIETHRFRLSRDLPFEEQRLNVGDITVEVELEPIKPRQVQPDTSTLVSEEPKINTLEIRGISLDISHESTTYHGAPVTDISKMNIKLDNKTTFMDEDEENSRQKDFEYIGERAAKIDVRYTDETNTTIDVYNINVFHPGIYQGDKFIFAKFEWTEPFPMPENWYGLDTVISTFTHDYEPNSEDRDSRALMVEHLSVFNLDKKKMKLNTYLNGTSKSFELTYDKNGDEWFTYPKLHEEIEEGSVNTLTVGGDDGITFIMGIPEIKSSTPPATDKFFVFPNTDIPENLRAFR